MVRLRSFSAIFLAAFFSLSIAQAYTVVTASTSAPQGLEDQFIASTTNQYQASLTANPFFQGTYQIQLFDINPNFNPAPKMQDLLNSIVTVDSYTYTSGWANGESYQQSQQYNQTLGFMSLCANATNFALIYSTTNTWNQNTCMDTVGGVAQAIFQLQLSTPTTVPGSWE